MAFDGDTLSTADTGAIVGGTFSDTFSVGDTDVDIVALDLTAGHAYTFDIDGGGDFYLRIFDQFGNEIKANDDGFASGETAGTSPFTRLWVDIGGTYYIALSPVYLTGYNPEDSGGRTAPQTPQAPTVGTLNVTSTGFVGFPERPSVRGTSTKGYGDETDALQDEDGRIRVEYVAPTTITASGDVDMARIDLAKGDVLVIDINGQFGGNPLDSVLRVFDRTGTELAIDDNSGSGGDAELIFSAGGTDRFFFAVSGAGNSAYDGWNGSGTVAGDSGNFTVVIHRNPDLVGASGVGDILTGASAGEHIVGLSGSDSILGLDGDDVISGGDDSDLIAGGRGQDRLYGDFGDDSIDGGDGRDVIAGGDGNDTVGGGRAGDRLLGGVGDDRVNGADGTDTVSGDAGDDTVTGGKGTDSVTGGEGNDSVAGGDGADRLAGGLGTDVLTGGLLADTFVFAAVAEGIDTITDFRNGNDRIDLSAIFAATGAVVTGANIGEYIETFDTGSGAAELRIDADGLVGGSSYTTVAVVENFTAAALLDINLFIV
jgi:Ca2+-binding RTX toxin-like protein